MSAGGRFSQVSLLLVALFFTDQMQTVAAALVAAVLDDDKAHTHRDKHTEDNHRHGRGHIKLNKERVDAEHHENRKVLVKVLHGN